LSLFRHPPPSPPLTKSKFEIKNGRQDVKKKVEMKKRRKRKRLVIWHVKQSGWYLKQRKKWWGVGVAPSEHGPRNIVTPLPIQFQKLIVRININWTLGDGSFCFEGGTEKRLKKWRFQLKSALRSNAKRISLKKTRKNIRNIEKKAQ